MWRKCSAQEYLYQPFPVLTIPAVHYRDDTRLDRARRLPIAASRDGESGLGAQPATLLATHARRVADRIPATVRTVRPCQGRHLESGRPDGSQGRRDNAGPWTYSPGRSARVRFIPNPLRRRTASDEQHASPIRRGISEAAGTDRRSPVSRRCWSSQDSSRPWPIS